MTVAQFAQQSKAIDQAASAESSGIAAIQTRGPVPGIDIGEPAGGESGINVEGGSISVGGGGGGGGRGGPAVFIEVGGVHVNIDVDKLDIENVDLIIRNIADAVRQGTTDGVQLAISLQQAAAANPNLAV